jgi:hypothetical protein
MAGLARHAFCIKNLRMLIGPYFGIKNAAMIIVKETGGPGNQFFQYDKPRRLAQRQIAELVKEPILREFDLQPGPFLNNGCYRQLI